MAGARNTAAAAAVGEALGEEEEEAGNELFVGVLLEGGRVVGLAVEEDGSCGEAGLFVWDLGEEMEEMEEKEEKEEEKEEEKVEK
eukprot:CAMPEP_0175151590 /NCGR_PEP_ID=MMETSP0087-20121206/18604_1 /TAXON_ID=136419 /ORGANISM="Unknown Unknown, Strain D1" /LENGTH=84 /DNA_ID=CAMNT_0016437851 /DNA_START=249 /DNA_END=507 /DNA_ORIENTATION=+